MRDFTIRIEDVYKQYSKGYSVFVNLKQLDCGNVEMSIDSYFSKNSAPCHERPEIITATRANEIYNKLRVTADPYIKYGTMSYFKKFTL